MSAISAAPVVGPSNGQSERFFHLTGRHARASGLQLDVRGLRPALFSRFHDLTRLRYDYPVVLAEREDGGEYAYALSELLDSRLREVAPAGIVGDRMRRHAWRVEREIRVMLAAGASGTLSELWASAVERLAADRGESFQSDLARVRAALAVDGDVVDCDSDLPSRFVSRAWQVAQARTVEKLRGDIDSLVARLGDLVKADHLRSEEGRHPATLAAGLGAPHRDLFDFKVMATLLAKPSGESALSKARRRRIESTLAVLRAQRFVGAPDAYVYDFDDVNAALEAFRQRLPAMAEVVKALAIAELEVKGRYVEDKDDDYFAGFDHRSLGPAELALFPGYLVRLRAGRAGRSVSAQVIEGLSSGAPLKILVESDDILDESTFADGAFSAGTHVARSAMGLDDVFVVQAASSHLHKMRSSILAAMNSKGAALISVFTGCVESPARLAPYLVAAAAVESRAFPAFRYDPSAGSEWADRFSLEGNPQADREWPIHTFAYADGALQRRSEELPFTLVDFIACDTRHAGHFALASPSQQGGTGLVPVATWLSEPSRRVGAVPSIHAVDASGHLHSLIVDERLVHAAARCAEQWHRLRELDTLRVGPAATAATATVPDAVPETAAPAAPPVATVAAAAPAEVSAEAASGDDPYIETARCTTCNECTQVNGRMFKYNENKQAYVADPDAGTYRELVEAAEGCQVAIIHPGKPRNPKEPGIEELLARAEPFR